MVCLLLSSSARPRVKKNWLPLSCGPAFAMATKPLLMKRNLVWNSSWKFEQNIRFMPASHLLNIMVKNLQLWPWMAARRWTLLLFLFLLDLLPEWWNPAPLGEILCHYSNLKRNSIHTECIRQNRVLHMCNFKQFVQFSTTSLKLLGTYYMKIKIN